jgi:predicted DNA-binding protein (UPF0251 family)
MPRPCKFRRIGCDPAHNYFKPRGIPLFKLEEVVLQLDELEALRLADLESLYHEEAALRMNISRQTFDRILSKAHTIIADAVIKGKAIRIEGGNVMINQRTFQCSDCNHRWQLPYGTGRPDVCPACKSGNIHRAAEERGRGLSGGKGAGKGGRCMRRGQKTT